MSYLFASQGASRAANWDLFSPRRGERGLAQALGRDLSSLQRALPRLCQYLAADPRNYAKVLKPSADADAVSLLPCLQALDRLWTASRARTLGLDCAHFIRFARRFTARLLDVCEHALEMSRLALLHGHFEADNPHVLRDLSALSHMLQTSSTLALWQVKWCLLDGVDCTARSASVLRTVWDLQKSCPDGEGFGAQLEEARCQFMQACLLCVSKLDALHHWEIHHACSLLQGIPRGVLLRCSSSQDDPERSCLPYIVFSFNTLSLVHFDVASASQMMGVNVEPVRDHFQDLQMKAERLCSQDQSCLARLLEALQRNERLQFRSSGRSQFVRVSFGLSEVVRQRQEWLQLAPSAEEVEEPPQNDWREALALRVGSRSMLQHRSGNLVALQKPGVDVPTALYVVSYVQSEAEQSHTLHLKLLSTDWFIDSAQSLDLSSERSGYVSQDVVLAHEIGKPKRGYLMIVKTGPNLPRASALPTRFRLKSSGAIGIRIGQPRYLWGAVCLHIDIQNEAKLLSPDQTIPLSAHYAK